MTAGAWASLAAAGLVAIGDWIAVTRSNKRLEYVCKPLVMIFLIGAALSLEPVSTTARMWFVIALCFGVIGDVFLMLPIDRFVAGLAAFLIGHLAYVIGLRVDGSSNAAWRSPR